MARFPTRESDIYMAALELKRGLFKYPEVFPGPPLEHFQLYMLMYDYDVKAGTYALMQAEERAAQSTFRRALAELSQAMRSDYTWAEGYVNNDPEKLALLNWGPRKTPGEEQLPGAPRVLTGARLDAGSVTLLWKAPLTSEGGAARSYCIERLDYAAAQMTSGEWGIAGASTLPEVTLMQQPVGIVCAYRVRALNSAGQSTASNVVELVT